MYMYMYLKEVEAHVPLHAHSPVDDTFVLALIIRTAKNNY